MRAGRWGAGRVTPTPIGRQLTGALLLYHSTRGQSSGLSFADVLLAGLAPDGGLYVPDEYPQFSPEKIKSFRGATYAQVAHEVIGPFIGASVRSDDLRAIIDRAYATFRHKAIAPLVQLNETHFVAELFHGQTLAFKDVAMQFLAGMMDHVLTERDQRATIVGATSGDTGGAAIDAFVGRERTDMFILFPDGRVSEVQRRQMTGCSDPNVHALGLDGTFDDCQRIVKAMFTDPEFRTSMSLSGVNSINWARIVAQIVYYFTTAVAVGAPDRAVSFCVPTGNFGDILAGWVAKRMGLPIEQLIIATNSNDILARCLETGRYESTGVVPTTSPSMDIQVSSNFERLLYEVSGRDPASVRSQMESLKQSGAFTLSEPDLAALRRDFLAGRASDSLVDEVMRDTLQTSAYLADPHTAVGLGVAEGFVRERRARASTPLITLATAHPAKFPDAVRQATQIHPALPPHLADLLDREERFELLPNDQQEVQDFIAKRARVARLTAA